ncbi:MAG TPA: hypothetical protein DDY20_10150 [Desulfobulbaceae bacterium]|nr:hypothetical protein [Desulfobulbaceae bacterium]
MKYFGLPNSSLILLVILAGGPAAAQIMEVEGKIAAGSDHTMAIKADGTLWGWGLNAWYQLGEGGIYSYYNTPVQIGTDTDWKAVSAGYKHTVAVKNDGTLWEWGQLCRDTQIYQSVPLQIGTDTDWAAVAAGAYFNIALKTDGTLWGWGSNSNGQLGLDDITYSTQNAPVQIGTDTTWTKMAAGSSHTIARKENGTLWAWGANGDGQLGIETYGQEIAPVQVGTETTWTDDITAGSWHTLARKANGTLWAWGNNDDGQLGDGTIVTKNYPVQIPGSTWTSVAAGNWHSLARKVEWESTYWAKTLWPWGLNSYGQLGDGTTINQNAPVNGIPYMNWATMEGGGYFSIGLMEDGRLWAWGDNTYGQLGDGTDGYDENKTSPVLIMNLFQDILTVKKTGTGSGTVTSEPVGINCGADCTEGYAFNTVVTLTATPAADSFFHGWSGGGCTGTGPCTVTMDLNKTVTATFKRPFYWPMFLPAITGEKR